MNFTIETFRDAINLKYVQVSENEVFFMGGKDWGRRTSKRMFKFYTDTREIQMLKSMLSKR
jgi:hypothetical protein